MPDPFSWYHSAPFFLIAFLFGYLLGSIPFGIILTRLAGTKDLRSIGSGNIGATNVLRTGSKKLAAATLLGDLLKGTVAVMVAWRFGTDSALIAGFAAFIGHCFPVWLRFKGGKGVATYIGILLGFSWKAVLVFAFFWLATAFISRYSSLSALVASLFIPFVLYFAGSSLLSGISNVQLTELFAALTVLLWLRHHQNIRNLLSGTESKIGKRG